MSVIGRVVMWVCAASCPYLLCVPALSVVLDRWLGSDPAMDLEDGQGRARAMAWDL